MKKADFLFDPSGSLIACHQRKEPTDDVHFSQGSPIAPVQLCYRGQRCLQLSVKSRLFGSHAPTPNTHYWFSKDMEWWFSAAEQVLDDIHFALTEPLCSNVALLHKASLCGPWEPDTTWLSRYVHYQCKTAGTILSPFENQVDKHLKELPDTLRFDVFLLQCWSEMTLEPGHQRTFETIYQLNDEAPEACMGIILAYMAEAAPQTGPLRPGGHCLHQATSQISQSSGSAPDLDGLVELVPGLAVVPNAMFEQYASYHLKEYFAELRMNRVPECCPPHGADEECSCQRLFARSERVASFIVFVRQALGIFEGPSLSSASTSTASSLSDGPVTPGDEPAVGLLSIIGPEDEIW